MKEEKWIDWVSLSNAATKTSLVKIFILLMHNVLYVINEYCLNWYIKVYKVNKKDRSEEDKKLSRSWKLSDDSVMLTQLVEYFHK